MELVSAASAGGSLSASARRAGGKQPVSQARILSTVPVAEHMRLDSGIGELDRVLGGGIMRGSSVLLGGEPGIGKSTLMLQAAGAYARSGAVLYISGEEAPEQIKMRSQRLGISTDNILLLADSAAQHCADEILINKPVTVIVDSIQTLRSEESSGGPGSPNQVRYGVQAIAEAARAVSASCYFIAHVTKEGSIAGPKLVEHLVDAVLYFDHSNQELRFLRSSKNRFGSTEEVGLFSMDATGLREVGDPSRLFLGDYDGELPAGTTVVPVYEGSRILMVEIQALTVPGKAGFGRVYSDRIDQRRISRVAAVIEKHLNLRLSDQDIYINVAGGIRIDDVGTELALAMAIYSARSGLSLARKACFIGELSLSGGVRPVSHQRRRVSHALEMGYSPIVIPKQRPTEKDAAHESEQTRSVSSLSAAVKAAYPPKPAT